MQEQEQEKLDEDSIPYFAWDRRMTVKDIRRQLRLAEGFGRLQLMAWILREAAFKDVWLFLTPREVSGDLNDLLPFLGRRKEFWKYIIESWHELGKL